MLEQNMELTRVMLKCKKCDSDFYVGVQVTRDSGLKGTDFAMEEKTCPKCNKSATYFQEDYFLEK
jgi:ribosomal protein L33